MGGGVFDGSSGEGESVLESKRAQIDAWKRNVKEDANKGSK